MLRLEKLNIIRRCYSFVFFYLFSVLKAINEDSPTVPTLLTDYILKGMYRLAEKFRDPLSTRLYSKLLCNKYLIFFFSNFQCCAQHEFLELISTSGCHNLVCCLLFLFR